MLIKTMHDSENFGQKLVSKEVLRHSEKAREQLSRKGSDLESREGMLVNSRAGFPRGKISALVSCLVLLLLLPSQSTVGSGGSSDPPGSDINVEWDFDRMEFRYHYQDSRNHDPDEIVVKIRDLTGDFHETLVSGDGAVGKNGSSFVAVSTLEPEDGHEYHVVFNKGDEVLAERSILASSREFIHGGSYLEYFMNYRISKVDGFETTNLEMELVAGMTSGKDYESMSASGNVEMKMESDDGEETMRIKMNGTVDMVETEREGELPTSNQAMNLSGSFLFSSENTNMNGTMEMRTGEENGLDTDSYLKMDGRWENGESNGSIFREKKTLRVEDHANQEGDVYTCLVLHSYQRMNRSGSSRENTTTSWEIREDGYDNETIYFDYQRKENGDTLESGSVYPGNSPVPEEEKIDILDIVETVGIWPANMVIGDVVVEPSETGADFAIRIEVEETVIRNIGKQEFNCFLLKGTVSKGGTGSIEQYICYDQEHEGFLIALEEDLGWGEQSLEATFELKSFPVQEDEEGASREGIYFPATLATGSMIGLAFLVLSRRRTEKEIMEPDLESGFRRNDHEESH